MLRRLEDVVEQEVVPSNDRELIFLTRLLQLAVGCRAMMRDRAFVFPGARLVGQVFSGVGDGWMGRGVLGLWET